MLTLSLFPGIGLLDLAFEAEGFCMVRGPDLLWGGDVLQFHPPPHSFTGIIGGPPCQAHSSLRHMNPHAGRHGDMIPEFERVVSEAQPRWFLMENVEGAPLPVVPGFGVHSQVVNNRWVGGVQNRRRRFSFGLRGLEPQALRVGQVALEQMDYASAVLAGHGPGQGRVVRGIPGRGWQERARLQGLPEEWIQRMEKDSPLTTQGLQKVVGNGVPLPLGRAIAQAVREALGRNPVAPSV